MTVGLPSSGGDGFLYIFSISILQKNGLAEILQIYTSAAGHGGRGPCRCLNLSTSMGGTRSKAEGEDRHDLEPEGTREDTRHEIYTGSGSRSSYPASCLG
jgi:hypothetical protein